MYAIRSYYAEFVFLLGYVEMGEEEKWESKGIINKVKAKEMMARFSTGKRVDEAFDELCRYWEDLLSRYRITSYNVCYTKLLRQQQIGHMDLSTMEGIVGIPIPEKVMKKFKKDENGLYFNERMDEEITRRTKHKERNNFV